VYAADGAGRTLPATKRPDVHLSVALEAPVERRRDAVQAGASQGVHCLLADDLANCCRSQHDIWTEQSLMHAAARGSAAPVQSAICSYRVPIQEIDRVMTAEAESMIIARRGPMTNDATACIPEWQSRIASLQRFSRHTAHLFIEIAY
jgi:hypothetical protein